MRKFFMPEGENENAGGTVAENAQDSQSTDKVGKETNQAKEETKEEAKEEAAKEEA